MAIYERYQNATRIVKRIYDGEDEVLEKFDGPDKIYPTPSYNDVVTVVPHCTATSSPACSVLTDHGNSSIIWCESTTPTEDWDIRWSTTPTLVEDLLQTACSESDEGCTQSNDEDNEKVVCVDQVNKYCTSATWNSGSYVYNLKIDECVENVSESCSTCAPTGTEHRGNTRSTCSIHTGTYCSNEGWNTPVDDATYLTSCVTYQYVEIPSLPQGEFAQSVFEDITGDPCTTLNTYASYNGTIWECQNITPACGSGDCDDLGNIKYSCVNQVETYCSAWGWGSYSVVDDYLEQEECVESAQSCSSCADTSPVHYQYICTNQAQTYCTAYGYDSSVYTYYSTQQSTSSNCNSCANAESGLWSVISSVYDPLCDMDWDLTGTDNVASCTEDLSEDCDVCDDDGNTRIECGSYVAGGCTSAGWSTSSGITNSCTASSGSCSCSSLGSHKTTCTYASGYGECIVRVGKPAICTTSAGCAGIWSSGGCYTRAYSTCVQTAGSSGYYPEYTYNCDTNSTTARYWTRRRQCEVTATDYYQERSRRSCGVTGTTAYKTREKETCVQTATETYRKRLDQTCVLDTDEFYVTEKTYTCLADVTYIPQWNKTTRTCTILEAT